MAAIFLVSKKPLVMLRLIENNIIYLHYLDFMDLCTTGLSLLDLINLQSTLSQPPIVADEIYKPVLSNILNSYKMNTTTLRGKI
jgi:hypothetical protein